ncbi:MFS general substrate transporter [Mollisia scopiformis]|uniref:MFS general substrate transporter n=1 Tax=Mollisia scopiformis TaxID=149040 RepID=A0A194X9P9_MOLSC|nr:MFS general substrate transporter [Mollisia scopiformis]KUJ16497.1 MFS general substrate transporter [Mollisia scopiformis]
MAQDLSYLGDAEKAEEIGASVQGAVFEEPAKPHSEPLQEANTTHGQQEETQVVQDEAQDLEALAAVTTGPVYSAFSNFKKKYIVVMVTWAAFISPTSANIYFPALNPLRKDLNVSTTLINLTLTSYMIFQGLAPTVFGDLADMAGRRPAYIIAFIIYMGANIGLALQNSYAALFILRCLQSTGSSGAIALGYGVVADVSTSSERGTYMGIVGAGTMMGPALGPVIGGILAQFLGWRSIFWFLVIFTGCFLVPYILTVPESGRNVVGNGSIPPQGWNMTVLEWWQHRKEEKSGELSRTEIAEGRRLAQAELAKGRKLRWPNPLKTVYIIMEKDVAMVLFYNSLIYTAFYDIMASIPSLFQEIYHFNDLQIGLCYIPFGCGCAVASFVNGRLLDRNYKKVARQIGFTIDRKRGDDLRHFPIERARLEIIWPLLYTGLACILCYGWALEKNANLAAPLILQFFIGLCVNGSFNILSTLVVDLYPQSPSTATAANNLVRCFVGAGGTGIINIMIDRMGRGWCFTFISLVCALASPMLLAELKCGMKWREERRVRMDKKKEEKKEREAARESSFSSVESAGTEEEVETPLGEEKKDEKS